MATETPPQGGSLVLAVDCADIDPDAVELSIRIAAREGRQLLLITVEHADWATAAGLSVTQLVRGHDLVTEKVDLAGMERMLGKWSARTEAAIAEMAQRYGVPMRRERRRGRMDLTVSQTVGPRDWLTVVLPASAGEREEALNAITAQIARFAHPLMISPRRRDGRKPVILVHGGGADAIAHAVMQASLRGSLLKVWTPEGADVEAVQQAADKAEVTVELETVPPDNLQDRLTEADAAAIVVDRKAGAYGALDLGRVMRRRAAADLSIV